ncbi:LysE family translocator [Glaciecola petra]|uniref:LysE family translocator n=1 Tax=Glaciecola petra TaxID=3075602 RepID=A0ABU2ZQW0_9ALTE|nr:LysE family translocator [Aestuariibacter sp. P117]MDT0595015.1 LysE family translocator [Aestuariibacter sp. P117]
MSLDIWLIYIATVFLFMITPGPSHLLMLSNSMTHGYKRSLATAAGDLSANALQMLAAGLGLAAILVASQDAMTIIKWLGVSYLVWMGVKMWRQADTVKSGQKAAGSASLKVLWAQGFITSAANPKAVVFFAALFPQFIDPNHAFWPQFLILSICYIIIDALFLNFYGASASWLSRRLKGHAKVLIHKIGAVFLVGAAIILSMKTLRDSA